MKLSVELVSTFPFLNDCFAQLRGTKKTFPFLKWMGWTGIMVENNQTVSSKNRTLEHLPQAVFLPETMSLWKQCAMTPSSHKGGLSFHACTDVLARTSWERKHSEDWKMRSFLLWQSVVGFNVCWKGLKKSGQEQTHFAWFWFPFLHGIFCEVCPC